MNVLKEILLEIIEAKLCPDHIHMLMSIPPKYSVASENTSIKRAMSRAGTPTNNPVI